MTYYVPPGKFPTRSLNRSVVVPYELEDPESAARLGWRAPVFVHLPGDVQGGPVKLACLDVTGAMVAERAAASVAAVGGEAVWFSQEELQRFRKLLGSRDAARQKLAFFEICRHMDGITNEGSSWQRFLGYLERNRFEASAWFERDRRSLSLTDRVTGDSVVELWDEDVDEAIEGGFLRAPRRPRPTDADWLPALLEYAGEYDLVQSLRASRPTLQAERPTVR